MRPIFAYESVCQSIYSFDIYTYHIVVYLVFGNSWDKLPAFRWLSSFWILAVVSLSLWACMVIYRVWDGLTFKDRVPRNHEMIFWVLSSVLVQPIFFYKLATYSNQWLWFTVLIIYRIWALRKMLLFLQEVREKMFLLQVAGVRLN